MSGLQRQFLVLAVLAGLVFAVEVNYGQEPEATQSQEAAVELETDMQKASYSIGYSMAENVRREFGEPFTPPLEPDAVPGLIVGLGQLRRGHGWAWRCTPPVSSPRT